MLVQKTSGLHTNNFEILRSHNEEALSHTIVHTSWKIGAQWYMLEG